MTARPDRRKTQPARRGAKTNFHHFRDTTVAFPGQQSYTGTRNFLDTSGVANIKKQTITLDAAGSADDVTIALFNSTGDQQALTTLNTIMTSSFYGTAAQTTHGAWTVTEVAKTVQDWLRANGATTATAAIDSAGKFAIALNSTSLNLAFRDETVTAQGSTQADAVIGFDADDDGTVDETVIGFDADGDGTVDETVNGFSKVVSRKWWKLVLAPLRAG